MQICVSVRGMLALRPNGRPTSTAGAVVGRRQCGAPEHSGEPVNGPLEARPAAHHMPHEQAGWTKAPDHMFQTGPLNTCINGGVQRRSVKPWRNGRSTSSTHRSRPKASAGSGKQADGDCPPSGMPTTGRACACSETRARGRWRCRPAPRRRAPRHRGTPKIRVHVPYVPR